MTENANTPPKASPKLVKKGALAKVLAENSPKVPVGGAAVISDQNIDPHGTINALANSDPVSNGSGALQKKLKKKKLTDTAPFLDCQSTMVDRFLVQIKRPCLHRSQLPWLKPLEVS